MAGMRAGQIVRQSVTSSVGNWATGEYEVRLRERILDLGGELVLYNENDAAGGRGVSGRDLSKRAVALRLLDDVDAGDIGAIAVWDIKRLSRDEWGADLGIIAKRLARRRALLVTMGRVYRPWLRQDIAALGLEGLLSAQDVISIRDTTFRGLFGRARREPFFKGSAPLGYTTEDTIIAGQGRGAARLHRRPIKDPADADIMADLAQWLDKCPTMGAVARRMYAKYGERLYRAPRPRKNAGWDTTQIRAILDHPLYYGQWEFGRTCDKSNAIWDEDSRRERLDEFVHQVPELAYWTREQAKTWLAKFQAVKGTDRPRPRMRKYEHPLLGLLACPTCGRTMVGHGRQGYVCPGWQGQLCAKPVTISEGAARAVLSPKLPQLVYEAYTAWAEATARHHIESTLERGHAAEAEARLRVVKEQIEATLDLAASAGAGKSSTVQGRLASLAAEETALEALLDDLRNKEANFKAAGDALTAMWIDAEVAGAAPKEALTAEREAAVLRLLVTDVRIAGRGNGRNRRHELLGYRILERGAAEAQQLLR